MNTIPKVLFCVLTIVASNAWSDSKNSLVELDDKSLGMVDGQAGVDLSLKLSLNQRADYSFDTSVCSSSTMQFCRLAISFNNRYDDGSNDTYNSSGVRVPSVTGKKQWIVFKGIQGTIIIDKLGLDGTDVNFQSKLGVDTYRGALNFSFDPNKPMKIRNFGFQSLSLETDTQAQEAGVSGYLDTTRYGSSDNAFDASNPDTNVSGATIGRERGFLGMSMNGNLALTGNIKIFSCVDHNRC